MNAELPRYLSYLLRLWQTSNNDEQIWRASLEEPGSGERRGFASLKDLFGFLQGQTESQDEQNATRPIYQSTSLPIYEEVKK